MGNQKKSLHNQEFKNLLLFRGVALESILGLLEDCPIRKLKKEEVLIDKGEPNHTVYLILSGRLRVHLELALDPIAKLDPGELVGEISVIDGQPTTAYVVADSDCSLTVLKENILWSLVEASPMVARNLLFILAQRLRHGDSLILRGQHSQFEFEHFAIVDAVTGLYNRRWLDYILPKYIERSKLGNAPLSILLIGIDDFEKYNDSYGPQAGDRALYTVSWTLRENTLPDEQIVRPGGNTFIALLPHTDASVAEEFSEHIRQTISDTIVYSLERKRQPSVTISVGVSELTTEDEPEALIAAARRALEEAEKAGGNRVSKAQRSF